MTICTASSFPLSMIWLNVCFVLLFPLGGVLLLVTYVHWLFAGLAGDITPYCGVSVEEKRAKEVAALDQIENVLGECTAMQQIRVLWEEYEAGATPEAKLVKDFDKVCCHIILICLSLCMAAA